MFTLEDDIRQHLQDDYPKLEIEGEPIRIKYLITHTSGLPANNKTFEDVPWDNSDGLIVLKATRNNCSKEPANLCGGFYAECESGCTLVVQYEMIARLH